ncbi:MAG: AAA family ATPase, partial [Halodesulfurarchaeum sp.]
MSDLGDFSEFDPEDEPQDETGDRGAGQDESEDSDAVRDEPTAGGAVTDDSEVDDEGSDDFERPDVEAAGSDRGVGTLAVSEGLRIAEEAEETRLRAYVTAGNRSDVRLGTYLLAPYPGEETLFCRITGLEYVQEFRSDDATEIHARRAMRSTTVDERDYKFIADLEPKAVLYPEGG